MLDLQVLASAQVVVARANEQDEIALMLEAGLQAPVVVVDLADHPDHGRRVDGGAARGLVVQAHVTAHYREVQRPACLSQAADSLLELPVDLGPVRVGHVQAVGDGEGLRAGGDDVARRLRDRELRADVGVEMAVASVARGRHRDPDLRALHAQHRRVASRRDHRRIADHVVVAADDRPAAAEVRARKHPQQGGADVGGRGQGVEVERRRGFGRKPDEPPHRRTLGEQLDRKARDLLLVVHDGQMAVVGHLADHGRREVPGLEDALDVGFAAAAHDHQHPFLRLREHHVVGRHASLAARHSRHVDLRPGARHTAGTLRHR